MLNEARIEKRISTGGNAQHKKEAAEWEGTHSHVSKITQKEGLVLKSVGHNLFKNLVLVNSSFLTQLH